MYDIREYETHTWGGKKEFIQRPKLNKNMQFGRVSDIYMVKTLDEIPITCNVNQWEFYNRQHKL